MEKFLKRTGIVILAAGEGKRLGTSGLPKVLHPLAGKPMIKYFLNVLGANGFPRQQIFLVIGYQADKVKKELAADYQYVLQKEQLGTAHAASAGEAAMPKNLDTMLVVNGDDSAFYTWSSLAGFIGAHIKADNDITVLTCVKDNCQDLGRVVRGESGQIMRIVEKENLTTEQESIKEINTGTYCLRRSWFRKNFRTMELIPGLEEYGMTTLIEQAAASRARFGAIKLANPDEWFGINTAEQLEEANRRMMKK